MEKEQARVISAYPIGNLDLQSVPEHLNAVSIINRGEFYIYNPFDSGLSVKRVAPESLTYRTLSSGMLLDSPEFKSTMEHGHQNLEKFQALAHLANVFWPAAAATFNRLLMVPKRDNGYHPNITPDMGLVVSPPKQKIQGPKLTRRPGPPTAGGR